MITRLSHKLLSLVPFVFLTLAFIVGLQLLQPIDASADHGGEATTVSFDLMKKISGPYPDTYTADQFSFNIVGTASNGDPVNHQNIQLDEFTPDTATTEIDLPAGEYTITENGPEGFVEEDWTTQWSGDGCVNTRFHSESTTIVIGEHDLGLENWGCRADNQHKPENTYSQASYYEQGSYYSQGSYGGGGSATGTIIIEKQTIPDGNQTDFSFDPSWSESVIVLSDGEQNSTALATGTHSVVENLPANWTQTSVVCSDESLPSEITLSEGETVTCVFTNTLNGGGGDNDPKYLVFGYVWHDANSSDIWEKDNPETEETETNEVDLDGWTVQITNGSVTYSTTTDPTGYYFFNVPVGTWTISEVLQSEWNQTFPNDSTHTVVVTGPVTQAEGDNFFASLMSYVIPTAFAQSPTTYGPYDFGNVFAGGSSYSQGSYGGGGSYSQGSYGGGGSSSGSRKKKSDPEPQVLGDATSAMPLGAPNTGAGGTAPVLPSLPTLLAIVTNATAVRTSKNG